MRNLQAPLHSHQVPWVGLGFHKYHHPQFDL